jgi:hypothetical protein
MFSEPLLSNSGAMGYTYRHTDIKVISQTYFYLLYEVHPVMCIETVNMTIDTINERDHFQKKANAYLFMYALILCYMF